MMNLEHRVDLLKKLGNYILSDDEKWVDVKDKAFRENTWFIPEFIDFQLHHIATNYISEIPLDNWIKRYAIPNEIVSPKNIGIVMAGNIPLAGFHDFLSAFIAGHRQTIKPSSKDFYLIDHIIAILKQWEPALEDQIIIADRLKGCDAYIATGSNNSSRYFDYYFSKYPHIIRRNRTSAGILTGDETLADLKKLADDIYLYFGLGCRNVTKLFVPRNYDFLPLLESFRKYNHVFDHHKYRNNYDYQLAIMIINRIYYMTNGSILLQENRGLFSPISLLHYEYYDEIDDVERSLSDNTDVQCVVARGKVPFGMAQRPALDDYADKADTLQFLLGL
jgi:hypothetical protein